MRQINKAVVHCTATAPMYDIGAKEIKLLHTLDEGVEIVWCGKNLVGKGWSDIGYHLIIRRNGEVENGRDFNVMGAHVYGENSDSIGIVMVGGVDSENKADCNFTWRQWRSLDEQCDLLEQRYGPLPFFGHRDFANKACPCFDVSAWRNGGKYNGPI